MKENTAAKVIKVIGIIIMVLCILAGIIVSGETTNEIIPTVFIVSGILSGTSFIGFGEIITLLQQSVNKQDDILRFLKDKSCNEVKSSKTVLQDIEDNLPNM